jgi:hypothetical protein
VRLEGLADADGFQLAEDVGDVLVVLGEDLLGEGDDGAGDTLRRVRPGLLPGAQGGEDPRRKESSPSLRRDRAARSAAKR